MTADPLPDLVVDCTERIERDGKAALDAMCREHPEHAKALRAAIEPLLACGIVAGPAPAADAVDVPRRIGDFLLRRELGRGGMGVVFEAEQVSLGRVVALKVLQPHLAVDEASVERFRREGSTAAALQHRGIAQVHAVGEVEGRHYLAMERIAGAPLDRVLGVLRARPVGSLDGGSLRAAAAQACGVDVPDAIDSPRARNHAAAAAAVVAQIAEALEYAHARGVVHRDVKPSNILLRPDGSAVLTDFGLARRDDLPGLTRSGAFAGTPFYTSPEQAAGRRVDHRTDVFSLGASLYELLTLHLPFAGASSAEVLAAIQTREPVDPRRHHRTLPRDLVAVVQRALEKEPERRYPSAGAFAADLRAFGSMRPVAARTVSPLGRVRRWARRQPLQAALAVSLGIGVPLVGALAANVLANRGMVQAAERQQRLEAAQAAILGGYAHVGEGRLAEGEHDLRRALELEPGDVEAWSGLAYAALRRGPEAARSLLAELDAAPGLLAGSPTLQRSRALLLEATGDLEAAREELERLGPPRDPLDSFWVGMRLMNRALTNESEDDVRAAYQHLLDAALGSPVARPGFVYWLGAAAGALRDEPAARRAAATLQRLWPRSGFAWQGVGLALGRIDVEAAIAAYRRALELVPDSTSVRNNLANALRNAGRRDESIAILRQLVLDAPTYATAHYNLGRQLFYAEDLAQALVHLRRATELAPREATFHHYLIWCLSRTGRRDEALAAAKAALAALPREALLWRDVANVHADASDVPATRAAIEQAIALAPDDPTGHATLGDVLAAQGEAAAARRSYERRIELLRDPAARRRAREELARFLLGDRGAPGPDPAAALAIAEELAVETGRRDAYVLSVLADALFRADRAPEALAALDAAIAAAAADPKAGKLLATLRQNRENVAARLRERTDR